jgi:hypothetical protein
MNDQRLIKGSLTVSSELPTMQLSAARVNKTLPDAYRLVGHRTDNGFTELRLQGYFTWTQGWSQRGGEWRDIETVDADELSDDKPYGPLL